MPTQPLPPKKEVALALLERTSVFVHLDPRVEAVVVPAGFKKQAQLVLQVGLNMPVPKRDLHLDDEGMTCTLSYNRTPFVCVVPWSSVYAVVGCDDGRGMIWPDDVPPEIAQAPGARRRDRAGRAARSSGSEGGRRQPGALVGSGRGRQGEVVPASVPVPGRRGRQRNSPTRGPRWRRWRLRSRQRATGRAALPPPSAVAGRRAASPLRPKPPAWVRTTGRRKRELPAVPLRGQRSPDEVAGVDGAYSLGLQLRVVLFDERSGSRRPCRGASPTAPCRGVTGKRPSPYTRRGKAALLRGP